MSRSVPWWMWLSGLSLVMLLVGTLGLAVGSSGWSLEPLQDPGGVLWSLRFPRTLLALAAGAGLGVSGAALQGLLRNPLADPYVMGISGGAAVGGVLALAVGAGVADVSGVANIAGTTSGGMEVIAAGSSTFWAVTGAAFVGAATVGVLILGLAWRCGRTDPASLILMGVVFNALASATVTLIKTVVSAGKAQEILFWLVGVIQHPEPAALWSVVICVLVGTTLLTLAAGPLNLLVLGDEQAISLGLPVQSARLVLFIFTALLVGGVVSVTGMIGFVGLVVPHIFRRLVGSDHRLLIPASALGGAALLGMADILARMTFWWVQTELPVGVLTALLGGPFFLFLLLRPQVQPT